MALIRWELAREIQSVQSEINRLFNTLFDAPVVTGSVGTTQRRWIPAMDVVEESDAYVLRADLPGLDHDDVKVAMQDGVLTVSGERRNETERTEHGERRIERSFGAFSRSLTLPDGVDAEAIRANFDKGVLEVRIPKPAARVSQPVEITVGSGTPAEVAEPAGEPVAA